VQLDSSYHPGLDRWLIVDDQGNPLIAALDVLVFEGRGQVMSFDDEPLTLAMQPNWHDIRLPAPIDRCDSRQELRVKEVDFLFVKHFKPS
jgi:hypothetical protein